MGVPLIVVLQSLKIDRLCVFRHIFACTRNYDNYTQDIHGTGQQRPPAKHGAVLLIVVYLTIATSTAKTNAPPCRRKKCFEYSVMSGCDSLEAAGHGSHADQRVRGDDRDVLVETHHQRLQLFRHLPRIPDFGERGGDGAAWVTQ